MSAPTSWNEKRELLVQKILGSQDDILHPESSFRLCDLVSHGVTYELKLQDNKLCYAVDGFYQNFGVTL